MPTWAHFCVGLQGEGQGSAPALEMALSTCRTQKTRDMACFLCPVGAESQERGCRGRVGMVGKGGEPRSGGAVVGCQ